LVVDLISKAKQVEYLINALPEPEPEENQAKRLKVLEEEMGVANEEYAMAVARARLFPFFHYRVY
jgi:mediator of RNA polymerase II transcription subunit 21